MYQKHHHRWLSRTLCLAIGGMLAAGNLWAQSAPLTLKQAFEAAWSRQPEAQSLAERREAAEARRQSADSWTVEPQRWKFPPRRISSIRIKAAANMSRELPCPVATR